MFHIKTPLESPARLVWKFIVSYFLKFLSHQLILFPTIPLSTGYNLPSISGQNNTNVVTVSCVKRLGIYPIVIEVTNYLVTKNQLKLVKTVKHSIIFPSYLLCTDNWPSNNILLTNLTNIVCPYQPRTCQS